MAATPVHRAGGVDGAAGALILLMAVVLAGASGAALGRQEPEVTIAGDG